MVVELLNLHLPRDVVPLGIEPKRDRKVAPLVKLPELGRACVFLGRRAMGGGIERERERRSYEVEVAAMPSRKRLHPPTTKMRDLARLSGKGKHGLLTRGPGSECAGAAWALSERPLKSRRSGEG